MKRLMANQYRCQPEEEVRIDFFCIPDRANVGIRVRFGTGSFEWLDEDTDFIRFTMNAPNITLRIQYAFINRGTCDNVITVVENMPSNRDVITAEGGNGDTDFKTLRFRL